MHLTALDTHGTNGERSCSTASNGTVGDPAAQGARREHPHRPLENVPGLDFQHVSPRLALSECLERRQPLNGIQKLGCECGVSGLTAAGIPNVPAMPQGGGEQRDGREYQRYDRDRHVDPGNHDEDQDRRQERDQKLRQEQSEVGLELLDTVDQG